VATDASLASIVAINNSSRNLNNSNNRLYHGQFRCQAVAGKMKVLYSHQLHLLSIWTLKIIQKIGKSVSICRANRSKALLGAPGNQHCVSPNVNKKSRYPTSFEQSSRRMIQ
jgi:hypothetical protein